MDTPSQSLSPPLEIPSTSVTKNFLQLCQNLVQFLEEQIQLAMSDQPLDESLERTLDGRLHLRRDLPMGLGFLAKPDPIRKRTVSLQIFFDPRHFESWKRGLGPLTLFFMDPYGFEIFLDAKHPRWGMCFNGQELYVDFASELRQEVAAFEIRDTDVFRTR